MNKRQTDILRILYKNPNFITLGELAKKVGVSVKTVRNDIAVIREELSKAEAGTVEAKPHIGVRLVSGKCRPRDNLLYNKAFVQRKHTHSAAACSAILSSENAA